MGSKKRGKVKGEQGRKDVGKRQLELTYIFPFRFSHSLHSLPNFPLKNATSQTKRPGSKCIQKRLPAITMASTRARPEWRHTIKISNTPSATAAGDKSTDRDYKYPNFPPPLFSFLLVVIESSPTAAAAANRILSPGIYFWRRVDAALIVVFVAEEQGVRPGVKAVVRRGTKAVLSWTRSRLVTKCMSEKWPNSWESCCICCSLEISVLILFICWLYTVHLFIYFW